ncbi:MAG: putative quinol monooxygenase [Gemmatimonadales bacterium]|nr:putative quinol monooxygenase [Gemmatimonadales bacterium]
MRQVDATAAATIACIPTSANGAEKMYGLIGKMIAQPGQRDALIVILLEGTASMPGCLSYIVARDDAGADALWVTEVWDTEASHHASLALPSVQAAIARGRPLIAGFGERFETTPVGGQGLVGSTR